MSNWTHSGDVISDDTCEAILALIKSMRLQGKDDDEIIDKIAWDLHLEGNAFDQLCNMVEEN